MLDNMSITGVTPLDCYPERCSIKNCKQDMKLINLCIPCQKPNMESVNEIKVSFCINKYNILNTILGAKIIFNISSKIKVIYTAQNTEQSLHSAHWDIDFCDFILLEDLCYDECNICHLDSFIGLEDVCVLDCNERSINLSLLYIICTNFDSNYCSKNFNHNYVATCKNKDSKKNCNTDFQTNIKNGINTYYLPVEYYEDTCK